jgi:DNA-binding transcriptional regulator YhcF (GntR family)
MEENLQAIMELRSIGFSDEEIQKMYNKQFEKDKRSEQQ